MRHETRTVRIGECVGPVDWSHEWAKDKPEHWRHAEQKPDDYLFLLNGMFTPNEIIQIGMYDGWPYWKPMPAICRIGPLGGGEWVHFNGYGVTDNSIFLKRASPQSIEERSDEVSQHGDSQHDT